MKKLILCVVMVALVAVAVQVLADDLVLPDDVHLISWNGETIEGTVYKESKETYSVILGKTPLLDVREDLDKYYEWVTITCRVAYDYGEPVYHDYTKTWVLSSDDLRENPALTWYDVIEGKKIPFPEGTMHIQEMLCIAGKRGDLSVPLDEESLSNLKTKWHQ